MKIGGCDLVEIFKKDGSVLKGIVMPSSTEKTVVIKLSSGYNIGIDKENVKEIKIVSKFGKSEEKCEELIENKKIKKVAMEISKKLPTISILHTGGTVASKVDYETGAVTARFTPEEILAMFPEIREIANIKSRLIRNMWSQDMRFSHYNLIAKEIQKEIKNGVNGIIITHGTDTLGYSAAALSFVLEGLPVPVLFVGAQRSSDRGSSDAFLNLICAVQFIAKSDFSDVAICMHEKPSDENCLIMPACKTRKLHTSRRDAFKVVNGGAIARVNKNGNVEFISKDHSRKNEKRKLKLRLFDEKIKVGIIRQYTNMFAEEYLFYKNYDGLVIEATGLGNLPITKIDEFTKENEKIFEALKLLVKKGVIVVLSPQTVFGRLNLNVYENGRRQQEIGILGNFSDMLTETTYIKLAWLLSNYPKSKVKDLIMENLRGELTKRNNIEEEFIK